MLGFPFSAVQFLIPEVGFHPSCPPCGYCSVGFRCHLNQSAPAGSLAPPDFGRVPSLFFRGPPARTGSSTIGLEATQVVRPGSNPYRLGLFS